MLIGDATNHSNFGVDLWVADAEAEYDDELLQKYETLLSALEASKLNRFHLPRDRRRYLITRVLARTVLCRYADVEPTKLQFGATYYGRPFIANRRDNVVPISFNISHTQGLVAMCVTRRHRVGIDVERMNGPDDDRWRVRSIFSPSEILDIENAPRINRELRFLEYWTLKEAYAKARGLGLSLPFDLFRFQFNDKSSIDVSFDRGIDDSAVQWQFWLLRLQGVYLAALCTQEQREQSLTARRTIPLVRDEILEYDMLRRSSNHRQVSR